MATNQFFPCGHLTRKRYGLLEAWRSDPMARMALTRWRRRGLHATTKNIKKRFAINGFNGSRHG